jgi:hypothetical protein
MTREPTQDELRHLVAREVYYGVSALVSTLAEGFGRYTGQSYLPELCEQAFELASPVPDYEEAAIQEGWEAFKDEYGANCYRDTNDGQTWACADWQALCAGHDIEPYDREVYEHWIISNWLADKLEAHGEKVDHDFAGLTVWARTMTGQAIYCDGVIEDIWRELHKEEA